MKKLLVLTLAIAMLTSCSNSVDLAIDNPTSSSVLIKVDTLTVEVPAKQVVWVEMGKGNHQITLENDSIVKYDFQESAYMINPTFSEYLKREEYYGDPAFQNNYVGSIKNQKVTFLGVELEGNFEVVKNLINPVRWEYGPREELPEMIEVEEGDNYTLITKLYDTPEVLLAMGGGSDEEQNN